MARKRSEETLRRLAENPLSELTQRLISLREQKRLSHSQLAEALGISVNTVNMLVRGEREIGGQIKYKLLTVFGYDIEADKYITASADAAQRVAENLVSIPFYRVSASAGSGIYLTDDEPILESLSFDKNYLESVLPSNIDFKYLNCITATGDSMQTSDGGGIKDGDLLFIDTSKRENPNGIYVININNNLRVKRILKKLDGSLSIQSDNPLYPAEIYEPEKSNYTISVIGKVVYNLSRGTI